MSSLKVYVTKGFPFWYHEADAYIGTYTVEVPDSGWLQAQIAAGLVAVVEEAKPKPKPPEDKPKPDSE